MWDAIIPSQSTRALIESSVTVLGAFNLRPSPEIPRQLDLLRRLCEQEGRDYDAIEKTVPFGFDVGVGGSEVGALMDKFRWLASLGVQSVFGWVVGVDHIKPLEIMGREVIPAAAELRAGA